MATCGRPPKPAERAAADAPGADSAADAGGAGGPADAGEASEGPLPPREAYRLWAPTYDRETPLTVLENTVAEELTPPLRGRTLLDVGCGTGRRLPGQAPAGPRLAVGVDLVWEMLRAGGSERSAHSDRPLVLGDLRALPLGPETFDVIWCRLALGHLSELEEAYAELARVAAPRAIVVVAGFHPEAAERGHARSFRDPSGELRTVRHHVHTPQDHEAAAAAAGLVLDARKDVRVGPGLRPFFRKAGVPERYEEMEGLAVVLALRFGRDP